MSDTKGHTILVMSGPAGPSLYLDDYRIAGPKPWGGGTVLHEFAFKDKDLLAAGVTLAPTPPAALDVERLTAALVELEESKLCNACLSDSCEEHDEMPDTVIGCGDGPALAAIYAALAATLKGADRE